jgi:hypothetical protein
MTQAYSTYITSWRQVQYTVCPRCFQSYSTHTPKVRERSSVPDPDPDSPDPHVFGPPGSGYGSGSGSFYLDFLSLKNYVNVPSKNNKHKNLIKKLVFVYLLKDNDENSRIRIQIRIHTNVIDSEHWREVWIIWIFGLLLK